MEFIPSKLYSFEHVELKPYVDFTEATKPTGKEKKNLMKEYFHLKPILPQTTNNLINKAKRAVKQSIQKQREKINHLFPLYTIPENSAL